MHTDVGKAPELGKPLGREKLTPRPSRSGLLLRCSGIIVSALVGPLAALLAVEVLGMRMMEAMALLFLISAWLGPMLMSREDG